MATHTACAQNKRRRRGQSRCNPGPLASPGSRVPHWAAAPCRAPLVAAAIGRLIKNDWPLSRFLHALATPQPESSPSLFHPATPLPQGRVHTRQQDKPLSGSLSHAPPLSLLVPACKYQQDPGQKAHGALVTSQFSFSSLLPSRKPRLASAPPEIPGQGIQTGDRQAGLDAVDSRTCSLPTFAPEAHAPSAFRAAKRASCL